MPDERAESIEQEIAAPKESERATDGPDLEAARTGFGGAEPPRADWQAERGGRIDPLKYPESPLDGDERIDEAIAESFPASDAPSFAGGK